MNSKRALLVLLAISVVVASWLVLSRDNLREDGEAASGPMEAQAPELRLRGLADSASIENLNREDASLETVNDQTQNFGLEDAVFLRGQMILPHGASVDPTLEIVAVEVADRLSFVRGTSRELQDRISKGWTRFARRTLHEDLSFEIPVHRDTKQVAVFVHGRFLYLEEAFLIPFERIHSPILLEPKLGACVIARVTLPTETSVVAISSLDTAQIEFHESEHSEGRSSWPSRDDLHVLQCDQSGSVEFRGVPVGTSFRLVGRHERLVPGSLPFQPALGAGELRSLSIPLNSGGNIAGRVVDKHGLPVSGLWVIPELNADPNPMVMRREQPRPGQIITTTDDDGRFFIGGLNLGSWALDVRGKLGRGRIESVNLVAAQETTEVEIIIGKGPSLRGKVRWPNGAPVVGCALSIAGVTAEGGQWSGDYMVDAEGKFHFTGLRPGPYVLRASENGWSATLRDVGADSTDLALFLSPPLSVWGAVVDERGEPVHSAFSVTANQLNKLLDMVTGKKSRKFETTDGRFELGGLCEGSWVLEATAHGYVCLNGPLEVTLPSQGEVALTLTRAGRIEGRVVDGFGKPIANTTVSSRERPAGGPWYYMDDGVRTDESGAFALENVPPGSRSLVAVADDRAPSEPLDIEVIAGTTLLETVIVLREGGSLTGEAMSKDGSPAAHHGVYVTPVASEFPVGVVTTVTDGGGRFEAHMLTPGFYKAWLLPSADPGFDLDDENTRAAWIAGMATGLAEIKEGETTHIKLRRE